MKIGDYSKVDNPFKHDKARTRTYFVTYPGMWGTQITEQRTYTEGDSGVGKLLLWTILEILVLMFFFNLIL